MLNNFDKFQANATKTFANRILYSTCDVETNENVSINNFMFIINYYTFKININLN